MKKLRLLHLYSGCIFAPLFVFFSVSGFWQTAANCWPDPHRRWPTLNQLSTLHTARPLKLRVDLTSTALSILTMLMAVSLVCTIVLGVVMAFRLGHRRLALVCLVGGVLLPTSLVLLSVMV